MGEIHIYGHQNCIHRSSNQNDGWENPKKVHNQIVGILLFGENSNCFL